MSPIRTTLRRAGLVAAFTTAGVLAAAGVAFAHVTDPAQDLRQGSHGRCSHLPRPQRGGHRQHHEGAGLPADGPPGPRRARHPSGGLDGAGDDHEAQDPVKTDDGTITEAVSEVTWTGGRIRHGQYQDFNVAFGQLPDDTDQFELQDPADLLGRQRRPLDARGGEGGRGRAGEPGAGAHPDRPGRGEGFRRDLGLGVGLRLVLVVELGAGRRGRLDVEQ